MKICCDPGHGHSNRRPGVLDPGTTRSLANGTLLRECDVALKWSFCLGDALRNLGVDVFFTRTDNNKSLPVGSRARLAKEEGCTHFVSVHVNDADSDQAHGTETLWRNDNQKQFARVVHAALVQGLQLRDRGIKERDDLAVLAFSGPACLIELGFIDNDQDMERFTDDDVMVMTCSKIADAIVENG